MISRLDGYVGRLLDTLRREGLAEKTLVIFTSDNGPHNESNHNLARFQPSGPLSGIKRSLTDGGIRVPAIAWWPGKVTAGRESNHVAYFGDWMATAAELGGYATAEHQSTRSVSSRRSLAETPSSRHTTSCTGNSTNVDSRKRLCTRDVGRESASVIPRRLWRSTIYKTISRKRTMLPRTNPNIVAKIDAYLKTARSESADWPIRTGPSPAQKAK